MQRDKLLSYLLTAIAAAPLVLALYLTIHYNLTLETLNTQGGEVVMALITINVMFVFVLATYEAYKNPNKFFAEGAHE